MIHQILKIAESGANKNMENDVMFKMGCWAKWVIAIDLYLP